MLTEPRWATAWAEFAAPSPVERWGRFIDDLDEVGAPDGSLQGNQATRVWFPINFGGAASTPGRTLSSATVHF
jgi:hypothetical protein